ncbi:hypothetical protein JX266_004289 [Neoarthrinium moseri]|nr:hypothetical protein JX266_004289 [Neoarthrinium moseri]
MLPSKPKGPASCAKRKDGPLTVNKSGDSKKKAKLNPITELINLLKARSIPVHTPGDPEYERSVANPNLMYRFSRPHLVVQPERYTQVQYLVREANRLGIHITIKNGGHSYAGSSTTDQGVLLDLLKLNKVLLDMKTKTMTLGGGALWGSAYKALIDGRNDGYVVNGGRCPNVGVSGFILGGGLGPFTRTLGMGCDSLKQATIVLADGKKITVKDSDEPTSRKGMLFWALCGAGGGNFGVVVEIKLGVSKLQNPQGVIVAGRYTWNPTAEDKNDFLSTMVRFYTHNWPDRMTIDSTWVCDLRLPEGRDVGVRFLVYFDGNEHEYRKQISKGVIHKGLAEQLKRRSLPEKSTRFLHETLVSQWYEETRQSFPKTRQWSLFTSFAFLNDEQTIKSVTAIIQSEMDDFKQQFKGERAMATFTFIHSGGQATTKPDWATAFRWRQTAYQAYIQILWEDKWLERDMRGFHQRFRKRVKPFSISGHAGYINFPDRSLKPDVHEKVYYGKNRQKLQLIKKICDPDNYFSWPLGVRLPEQTASSSGGLVGGTDEREQLANAFLAAEEEEGSSASDSESVDEEGQTDDIAGQQWESGAGNPSDDWLGKNGFPSSLWGPLDDRGQ